MLYFKIENHDNTPNQVFNLYSLQYESSYSGTTAKLDDTLINNVWYPIEDLLLKSKGTSFTKEILFNSIVNSAYLKTVANEETKSNYYNLLTGDVYLVENKKQSAKDGRYFSEPIDSNTDIKAGTGKWAYPFSGQTYVGDKVYSYKFRENNQTDMFLILSLGNPRSSMANDPLIKWNGISEVSYKNKNTYPHRSNQYLDITALAKTNSPTTFIASADIKKPINFYLNGNLIKTIDSAKKDSELFTTTLNANDILETKYIKAVDTPIVMQPVHIVHPENIVVTPTKLPLTGGKLNIKAKENFIITGYHVWHTNVNSEEDWTKKEQNIKETELNLDVPKFDYASTIYVSVDTQTTLPVYYNLPTIAHVTFSPNKAELGKKTTITATPDTGYTINKLTFFADNENIGGRIFTSSYKNGIIDLDLTSYSKDDLDWANQTIEHSEDIKKLEYGTYVLPKITGITFTLDGSPVTSVKLGTYYNFGVQLDSHYRFSDDKGKGLVIKNDDGTTTNLSSWNDNNYLGVHFENCTTADQLKNAYWDINIQKFDHSDEHEKQIPIQLVLTHATADKTSILENSTDTITLTADNGYIFDDDIVYYSYDINFGVYNKLIEKANKQSSIKIDLNTGSFYDYDKLKDNPISRGVKPYIKAVATSPTVKPTGTKSISLYSMTDGELNTFMNSVLLQFNSSPDGTQTSLANFLDFVNQIYRIPLNIPNDLLTPVNKVHSGKWNINVNTNQITQDHFSINFDPIKVTPHYKNANDYNSITVSLVIPFAKEVELNINDVMNNTIKITYNIDLLQGKTTIIVNNDTGTIYTNQIDISTQLEFYGLHYDKRIGGLNSTYINNVLQPYISISYHKPITNLISYSTNENGVLKDYNGFVRVSHGTLMGNMNDTEYNEILNLLYGGIKIGTKRN